MPITLEGNPFALAFLDLHMPPGPDGQWTAEQIQKLDPGVNIILVTGYSASESGDLNFNKIQKAKFVFVDWLCNCAWVFGNAAGILRLK